MRLRRQLVICLLVTGVAFLNAQRFPSPLGYVSDFAGVISPSDESRISRIAQTVEQQTSIELAIVSVETMAPYGSIEEYSIDLATAWEIGKAGEDNGLLIIVAIKERKTRIEVGYGLEGVFPDGLVGRIMDTSMVPYFRNNDFSTGLAKATEGIAGVISEEYGVDLQGVAADESAKYTSNNGSSINLTPIITVIFIIMVGGGRFLWPLLFLGGLGRRRRYYRGGFGVGSRGGFGSRGGGGGFGGFGGGGFGGGGASRGF